LGGSFDDSTLFVTALAQATVGRARRRSFPVDLTLIAGGAGMIALLAQVSVRLPFTPVPVTGQTLGVLLVGASLGSIRGSTSTLLYLGAGAAGLPVFADGSAGRTLLLPGSPTGGYLWGFVLAALLIGWLSERGWDRGLGSALGAMLLGEIVIFTFGVVWLSGALDVPGAQALRLGLYPFVLGDLIKLLVAAGTMPLAWKVFTPRPPGALRF
jgi:biotin transport system substrate-specific component